MENTNNNGYPTIGVARKFFITVVVLFLLAGMGVSIYFGMRWVQDAEKSAKQLGCQVANSTSYILLGNDNSIYDSNDDKWSGLTGLVDRLSAVSDTLSEDALNGRLSLIFSNEEISEAVAEYFSSTLLYLDYMNGTDISEATDGLQISLGYEAAKKIRSKLIEVDEEIKSNIDRVIDTALEESIDGIDDVALYISPYMDKEMISDLLDVGNEVSTLATEASTEFVQTIPLVQGLAIGLYCIPIIVGAICASITLFALHRSSMSPVPVCIGWASMCVVSILFMILCGVLLLSSIVLIDGVSWIQHSMDNTDGGWTKFATDLGFNITDTATQTIIRAADSCLTDHDNAPVNLLDSLGANSTIVNDYLTDMADNVLLATGDLESYPDITFPPINAVWDLLKNISWVMAVNAEYAQESGQSYKLMTYDAVLQSGCQRGTRQITIDVSDAKEMYEDVADDLEFWNGREMFGVEVLDALVNPLYLGSLYPEVTEDDPMKITKEFDENDPIILESYKGDDANAPLYRNAVYWAMQKEIIRDGTTLTCPPSASDTDGDAYICTFDDWDTWMVDRLETARQNGIDKLATIRGSVTTLRDALIDAARELTAPVRLLLEEDDCSYTYDKLYDVTEAMVAIDGQAVQQSLACLCVSLASAMLGFVSFLMWRLRKDVLDTMELLPVSVRRSKDPM
eukprot:GHVO01017426.1.p1 GENE.GHVO01017426.1~~GHVO01017426.1.p1  ORF type:complete len:772 (+),score=125.98 GHVO01017426.1:273-2318(+)